MPNLELYYFDACPFCQIVLQTIKNLKIKVKFNDIYEKEEHLQKLVKDTGKKMVPCLYIDNVPMHESRDIINWLEANATVLEKN